MIYIAERFRRFCAFLTGFVFFISGILKLLDPVGAGLVMDEYFDFLHLGFLGFAAKPLGTLMALAESIIGAALITGVWRKQTAVTAMIFQGFFTLLTLILVIFNPEMDCGCFGEAIHLTHAQTFIKNLILCALIAFAFLPFRDFGMPGKRKYVSFGIVVMSVIMFMIYSWAYIPLVDFTDYKPSATLAAADTSSEEMYESRFIYEKDGVRESFTLEHLPDSTWTFVSTETVKKNAGAQEPVTLSIKDAGGEYVDHIAAEGNVMIISIYNPEDIGTKKAERIERFAAEAKEAGFTPVIIEAESNVSEGDLHPYEVKYSDYKTLISLNRSNGGATCFCDGTLVCKWAYKALPEKEKLDEISGKNGLELAMEKDTKGSLGFQGFLLYVFAVMLLL